MKLCYVRGNFAWFTSGEITGPDRQLGSDWRDIPCQLNSGEPDYFQDNEIVKVAWEGPLVRPGSFSVFEINEGFVPWLQTSQVASCPHVKIYAGVDIEEFGRLIQLSGGKIYKYESLEI